MTWTWPGGSLSLAPSLGRVLQVTLRGVPAFWTNPSAPDWNVGGDRLWLGPERDWFWGDSAALSDHVVPASIDPGTWRLVSSDATGVSLAADTVLTHRRTTEETSVGLTRTIKLVDASPDRVVYETRTAVTVHSGQPVSAWSIVSVPLSGTVTAALRGPLTYRDYLSPIDPARLTVSEGRLSLRLTGEKMMKVGVSPDAFAGSLDYTRPVDGGALRVERVVDVRPDLRYCDLPVGVDPTPQGDALQIFEDDGHYGGYAELEHHSPAAAVGSPVVDVCRTAVSVIGS
jgi:hypothetical protein